MAVAPSPSVDLLKENSAGISAPGGLFGGLFGLSTIGDIAGVVRQITAGTPSDQIKIPKGLQEQALTTIVQQSGAKSIEGFLAMPDVFNQIKAGLRSDLMSAEDPKESIIFKFIADMAPAKLKEMLAASPELQNFLKDELAGEIKAHKQQQIAQVTMDDVLEASGVPADQYPESLAGLKAQDLSIDHLTGLSNQDLVTVMAAMPPGQLEDTLNRIAEEAEFSTDTIGTIPVDATFNDKQMAVTQLIDAIAEDKANLNGEDFVFGIAGVKNIFAAATQNEDQIRAKVFDGIRESFTQDADNDGTVDGQQHIAAIQAGIAATADAAAENFDIASLSDEKIQQLFDQNKDTIATKLADEKNWAMIDAMITTDLIIRNKNQVIDAMLPQMTQQGLEQFENMLSGLPPELQQLIGGFMEFFAGILDKAVNFAQNMGFDIGGQDQAPPPSPTPEDQLAVTQ